MPATKMDSLPQEIEVLVHSLVSRDFTDYEHFLLRAKIAEGAYGRLGHVTPVVQAYDMADRVLALSARPRFHGLLGSPPVQISKTLALTLDAAVSLIHAGYGTAKTLAADVATELVELHLHDDNEGGSYACTPYKHCYRHNGGVPRYTTSQDPSIYMSSFCGKALLRYSEIGHSFFRYAVRIGNFLKNPKSRVEVRNRPFFKYFIGRDALLVHNVNTQVGSFLLHLAAKAGDEELHEIGVSTLLNSVCEIADDGSLNYFSQVDSMHSAMSIDNFHTGFVICDLLDASELAPEASLRADAFRMLRFYTRMFDKSGTPSYTPWRRFPIDIHDYAVGMITFSKLSDFHSNYLQVAEQIRSSAARRMRDSDGLYWFQRYPLRVHKAKFLRWNQAWMLRAISDCILRETIQHRLHEKDG